MGELTLRHVNDTGINIFHLLYLSRVNLWEIVGIVSTALVRGSGTPAPVGSYFVEMSAECGVIDSEENCFCNAGQEISLVRCGLIEPGEASGIVAAPRLRTLLNILGWQLCEPDSTDGKMPPPRQDGPPRPLVGNDNIAPFPRP